MQNKNLQTIFVLGTVYSSWWHAEFTFSNYANVRVRLCSNYANAFVLKKTISKYCEHTHVRTEGGVANPRIVMSSLLKGPGSTKFADRWPDMQPVVLKLLKQEHVTRDEWQNLFW